MRLTDDALVHLATGVHVLYPPGHSVVHSVPLLQCVLQQVTSQQPPQNEHLVLHVLLLPSDSGEQGVFANQEICS